jgi:hypothetical protein
MTFWHSLCRKLRAINILSLSIDIIEPFSIFKDMNRDSEWVELMRTNPMEAEIIRSKLKDSGIEVQLLQEAFGKIAGITTDGLGVVKIFIREDRLEEARKIIGVIGG